MYLRQYHLLDLITISLTFENEVRKVLPIMGYFTYFHTLCTAGITRAVRVVCYLFFLGGVVVLDLEDFPPEINLCY